MATGVTALTEIEGEEVALHGEEEAVAGLETSKPNEMRINKVKVWYETLLTSHAFDVINLVIIHQNVQIDCSSFKKQSKRRPKIHRKLMNL